MKDFSRVQRILWIIFFLNLIVALLKIILGALFINSSSLTADGYHSLSDGASNIVGLIGIRLASRPVDNGYRSRFRWSFEGPRHFSPVNS